MLALAPIFREEHIILLLDWATQISAAEECSLEVLWCPENHQNEPHCEENCTSSSSLPPSLLESLATLAERFPNLSTSITRILDQDREKAVLKHITKSNADLLIIGKQISTKSQHAPESATLARNLYRRATCDVVLLRLIERSPALCEQILIPAAGGMNSRRALRLGDRLARLNEGKLTPLFVQPEGDDVSEAVGDRILHQSLVKARIKDPDRSEITPRVIVNDNVIRSIRQEVSDQPYHLVIIGGSNDSTLRLKLFGTIPESLTRGDNSTTIAVIRRALPIGQRMKQAVGKLLALSIPQLTRDDRIRLYESLQTKSKWTFDFMALILLSTAIAALGLTQNSPAVIIGAMLVAPLMTPLLGSGLAIVQGNAPLIRDCAKAITLGFFSAVVIGYAMGLIAKPFTGLTTEMMSRGGPSLLDMGVAFLSGVAASYCLARPGLTSALAGVAIAAALVPPIATVGMSLSLDAPDNALGAALLFGTNVVAIILGAALNFLAAGIRGKRTGEGSIWPKRILVLLVLSLAIFSIPLGSAIIARFADYQGIHQRAELLQILNETLETQIPDARLTTAPVIKSTDKNKTITLNIASPTVPDQSMIDLLRQVVELTLRETNVTLRVHTQLLRESSTQK